MKEAAEKAGVYAYVGRKRKKRDYRSLWIVRINAAAPRARRSPTACFMNGLKTAGIELDRKSLAELAAREPAAFAPLVEQGKAARAPAGLRMPVAQSRSQRCLTPSAEYSADPASAWHFCIMSARQSIPPRSRPRPRSFREELAAAATDARSAGAPHPLGRPQGQLGRRLHGARRPAPRPTRRARSDGSANELKKQVEAALARARNRARRDRAAGRRR